MYGSMVLFYLILRTLGESAILFGGRRSMRVFSTLSIPKYYQRYEAMLGYATCVIHLLAGQLTQKETRWQHQMQKNADKTCSQVDTKLLSFRHVLWSMCPCTSWTCWTGPWSPFPPWVLQHPMTAIQTLRVQASEITVWHDRGTEAADLDASAERGTKMVDSMDKMLWWPWQKPTFGEDEMMKHLHFIKNQANPANLPCHVTDLRVQFLLTSLHCLLVFLDEDQVKP